MVAAFEHFPDVLGLHCSGFTALLPLLEKAVEVVRLSFSFFHPSLLIFTLFPSFLGLRESCLNLQGACQDGQDRRTRREE